MDPMCRNSEQFTPLHLTHNIEIVKFLILEMHCDPTSRNAHNTTALHIAAIEGHLDIVPIHLQSEVWSKHSRSVWYNSSSLCCSVWPPAHSQVFD